MKSKADGRQQKTAPKALSSTIHEGTSITLKQEHTSRPKNNKHKPTLKTILTLKKTYLKYIKSSEFKISGTTSRD